MMKYMRGLFLIVLVILALAATACDGGREATFATSVAEAPESAAFDVGGERLVVIREVTVEKEVMKEVPVEQAVTVERLEAGGPQFEVVLEREAPAPGQPTAVADSGAIEEEVASLVTQQRIIVRTADMHLIVTDVVGSLEQIAGMVEDMGGWVVSTDRSQKQNGFISFRVPADRLGDAIASLRELAAEVESEVTNSRDVTDEYVDNTARLKNLRATEEALLRLLERADGVEDALSVQRVLTEAQGQIEVIQGRIKFLEETAAFSLVNVRLELAAGEISVDAGPDQAGSLRELVRFRASFEAPNGIEDYVFTWDFGDGSRLFTSGRTAPSDEEGRRLTATVTHFYSDERDSPYFAEVEITGTGDAGRVEGSDSITVIVTKLPTIEVFAGESRFVDEGEKMEYNGSFTRPAGLTELTFSWDFGDGTEPVTGSLDEGVTTAVTTHEYADHRPFAYTATLTITGQTEAGEVEGKGSLNVLVSESPGYVVGGFSVADAGRTAVRTLSRVGQSIGIFFVWFGIFSPVWLLGGAAVWWFRRRRSRS